MKPLWTLIKLYVNSIFRFPVIRCSKDAKERRNAIMGLVAIGVIVVSYGGMSGTMTARMLSLGIDPSVPFLMISAMASLFALAMAFAQGSATLSGFSDFDTLMGMPIKTSTIVLARFSALYLTEAVYCLAYLLPCGLTYAILGKPAWWFYPTFLLMTLLLPVAPIVLGSGADLLLSAAFAKSKYRKGVTSTIKMILLLGFIVFAYLVPRLSESFLAAPGETASTVSRLYPPAEWFAKGAAGAFGYAALFIGCSVAACALFVLVLNRTFLPLHDRLSAGYHVKDYRLGALKSRSPMRALFRIERKRFFHSTAWVVNTIFGSIMIVVLGVAGTVLSGTLSALLRSTSMQKYAAGMLSGVLIFCATIAPTTACAISMEGKEIWIAKTIPVPAKLWLRAKLLMNLVLVGPSLLAAITMLAIAYRGILDPVSIPGLYLAPIAALTFTTTCGLFVNAKMPRLSWKTDAEVVKQSGSVFVMMLIGLAAVAVTVIPMLLTGRAWAVLITAAALFAAAGVLYRYLMKNAEQIRANL